MERTVVYRLMATGGHDDRTHDDGEPRRRLEEMIRAGGLSHERVTVVGHPPERRGVGLAGEVNGRIAEFDEVWREIEAQMVEHDEYWIARVLNGDRRTRSKLDELKEVMAGLGYRGVREEEQAIPGWKEQCAIDTRVSTREMKRMAAWLKTRAAPVTASRIVHARSTWLGRRLCGSVRVRGADVGRRSRGSIAQLGKMMGGAEHGAGAGRREFPRLITGPAMTKAGTTMHRWGEDPIARIGTDSSGHYRFAWHLNDHPASNGNTFVCGSDEARRMDLTWNLISLTMARTAGRVLGIGGRRETEEFVGRSGAVLVHGEEAGAVLDRTRAVACRDDEESLRGAMRSVSEWSRNTQHPLLIWLMEAERWRTANTVTTQLAWMLEEAYKADQVWVVGTRDLDRMAGLWGNSTSVIVMDQAAAAGITEARGGTSENDLGWLERGGAKDRILIVREGRTMRLQAGLLCEHARSACEPSPAELRRKESGVAVT